MRDEKLMDIFAREIAVLRGVRPATIRTYVESVRGFARWFGRPLRLARRKDFLAWREAESTRRTSSGLQVVVSGLRIFFAWLEDTGRLRPSPFPRMVVHRRREQPRVPTTTQFLHLRASLEHDLKHLALIEFLTGTGLRISAALAVRREQLVFSDAPSDAAPTRVHNYVRVDPQHCKGHYASSIPMTPWAARTLKRYLKTFPDAARIFPVAYSTAHQWVRNAGLRIDLDLHPHSLRHLFGCLMYWRDLEGGKGNTVWVANAMGHANILATDTYIRAVGQVVKTDIDWHEVVWHFRPRFVPARTAMAPAKAA